MKLIFDEIKNRRKLYLALAITGIVLYTVYCLISVTLMLTIGSDIRYESTALPYITDEAGKLFEILSIAACCGIVTLGVVRFGCRRFWVGGIIYSALVWYKYSLSILLGWVNEGSLPLIWLADLGYALLMAVVELIPFVVVWLVVGFFARSHSEKNAILKKSGRAERLLPYKNLFDIGNIMIRSALICSIVVFVTKFAGRFIDDALVILSTGFPREFTTIILMLVYYFSSIIFAVLCYFVMLLTMHFVGLKTVKDW